VLLTGGAGNIGGSLARALVATGRYYVVVVDDLSTGSRSKLPSREHADRWRFVNADANRMEELRPLFDAHRFRVVFHYAALVGVQRTLSRPLDVLADIDGIRAILELCREFGVDRYYYASSSEVYGEPVTIPQSEATTPLNSRLPYAVVKNVGEVYARAYHQQHGLNYTLFRFFNTYGPHQTTDFVISRFISQALRGEPITVFGDGSQTRTFCYVDDNIDATLSSLENGLAINQTMNIGNDEEISMLDLARRIVSLLGSSSPIVHLPALAEGDMTRRKPDITLMRTLLDRPLLALDKGILRTAESLMAGPAAGDE
jgi:UDP-glucose 4-epimerase